MSSGRRYRQYAEGCLRDAQRATPVQRAHLLRVARTWFEIADQTEASEGDADDRQPTNVDASRPAQAKQLL